MDEKLLAVATPIFLVAMIAEWLLNRWYLRRRGMVSPTGGSGGYRADDTLTDLGCGIGQQLLDPLLRILGVGAYAAVQQRWGLWTWDRESPAHWLLALLLVDLAFYAFHRASHRVRLLWAVHHVHHSSDEYNLAVALRQPWLEKLADLPFYLPLALLGMPVELYVSAFTLNLIYQFFVHSRWVPKLGPLEALLNTPSHHRVHHGVNPQYLDTNYGGMLIVWDRLFGTFAPEEAPVVYGTVTPLRTWNVWTVHIAPWREMARAAANCPRWLDKLWTLLGPPDWRPVHLGGALQPAEPDVRERGWPELALPKARRFAVAVLLYVGGLLTVLQQVQGQLGGLALAGLAAAGLALMAAAGARLEGRNFLQSLEYAAVVTLGLSAPLLLDWRGLGLALWIAATAAMLALAVARDAPLARAPEIAG